MSKKMKTAKFTEPIFDSDIILTFGNNDELRDWYKKQDIDPKNGLDLINPNWQAFVENIDSGKGTREYHIHFEVYGFTTIVHETNHLTFNVLNDRGIPFIEETKEVYAYYQDWVAGKCRDYLEKWTK